MNASRLFAGAMLSVLVILPHTSPAAEHVGGINEQRQILGGQGESFERDFRPPDQSRWTYPVSGIDTETRTDRVFQAFPQDGAIFTKNMVVTLGWQPADTGAVATTRYEVLVYQQGVPPVILRPGESIPGKPTTVLYQAPGPGTYTWQVWAHFDGRVVPSVARTFTIIP